MPCTHAISCILRRRLKVEDYVDAFYHKETYMKAYALSVMPMPGEKGWEKTGQAPLDPPNLVIQPGRPKKLRRREPGEGSKTAQVRTRHGKNKCGNCREEGHTRNNCKNPTVVPEQPRPTTNKGGRPPRSDTMPMQPQKRKYTKRKI